MGIEDHNCGPNSCSVLPEPENNAPKPESPSKQNPQADARKAKELSEQGRDSSADNDLLNELFPCPTEYPIEKK